MIIVQLGIAGEAARTVVCDDTVSNLSFQLQPVDEIGTVLYFEEYDPASDVMATFAVNNRNITYAKYPMDIEDYEQWKEWARKDREIQKAAALKQQAQYLENRDFVPGGHV